MTSPSANPLLWLVLFVTVSLGATFANSRHLLDEPRSVATRVVAPLQAAASRVGHTAQDISSGWRDLTRLREENAALRQTVDELLQETVRSRAAELENRDLRDQLHYEQEHRAEVLVPGQVIGFDSSTLLGYATIDRGQEAQLQEGMTVIATGGLVGRITATTGRTSTVLLINHPSSSVNAVIQGAPGAIGTVTGQADGSLVMQFIPQTEAVKVNDLVVTSGLGGGFPRNVPIGRVVAVETRDINMFQQAVVQPFVDFRKLSKVLVDTSFLPTKL